MTENVKPSAPHENPSLVTRSRLDRLADDVLACDGSILGVMVVDDVGRLLATGAKPQNPAYDMHDQERLDGFGALAAVLVGAAANGSDLVGPVDSITVSFGNAKIIIFKIVEYGLLLVVQANRSSDSEFIVGRVSELLATSTSKWPASG